MELPFRSGEATSTPTLCDESKASTATAMSLFFIPSLTQPDMSGSWGTVIDVTPCREQRYRLRMFSSDARRLLKRKGYPLVTNCVGSTR